MAYSPRLLGQPAKPSQIGEKLAKTWDILSPYVTGPVDAWKGLMEADLNTLLYDKGAGGRKAVEDAFNVGGTVAGGSSVVPKPSNALNMGIKAYHASPYSFDKFEWSPKTRGTGEGAQAYGDGLYFAEAENVAEEYRKFFANRDSSGYANAHMNAQNLVKRVGGDAEYAAEVLREQLASLDPSDANYARIKDTIDIISSGKHTAPLPSGAHMYEVNIDADPNAFLDWDKPLSEQPKNVQDALAKIDPDLWHPSGNDYDPMELGQTAYMRAQTTRYSVMGPDGRFGPGGATYEESLAMAGGDPKRVRTIKNGAPSDRSEALKQAGIPGIKYLDAGSRGAGDGTSNYVVFDDKLISIVRKYGIVGASAMLGYNILEGMDKAQADTLNKADFDYRADEFYRQGGV